MMMFSWLLVSSFQVEANCDFTNSKRIGIEFSPNDPAAASFLKVCTVASFSLFLFFCLMCLLSETNNICFCYRLKRNLGAVLLQNLFAPESSTEDRFNGGIQVCFIVRYKICFTIEQHLLIDHFTCTFEHVMPIKIPNIFSL